MVKKEVLRCAKIKLLFSFYNNMLIKTNISQKYPPHQLYP